MTPFGPNTAGRVLPGVQALRPNGMTPIAASLQEAAKDFSGKEGQNNIIVLLSDGEEDCNGDPCAAAKAVHDAGIKLQVNVIGFHVEPKERTQLKCVADAGGGKYYDAENAGGLKVAASDVERRIAASPVPSPTATFVKAEEGLYGAPIRGGDSFDKTVPIPTGKLFHLDHSQQAGHYDFFTIPAHSGQSIIVTMKSGPSGVLAIGLNDPTREEVARKNLVRNERATDHVQADVADQQDGTYYMLVGNDEWPSEMDGTFHIDLVDNSDANSGRDAGSSDSRALEIHPGTYPKNYVSESDPMDVFKFKAGGGKTYQFKARPAKTDGSIDLAAVDDDGNDLGKGSSPNKGAVAKIENLKLQKTGFIYVRVQYGEWSSKQGHYGIGLGEGEVESPHPHPEQ
jgi:von Willebrand factor type A domain